MRLDDNLRRIITTKVTDGFVGIEKQDKQVAIIAGMGANTIIDIIEKSLDFAKSLDYLVLASNVNTEKLRTYLVDNNFEIIKDFLSYENNKYYDILKVRFGNAKKLTLAETYYGKDDINTKAALLVEKLAIDYKKNQEFRKDILNKSNDLKSLSRIDEKLKAIEEIRNIWKLEN